MASKRATKRKKVQEPAQILVLATQWSRMRRAENTLQGIEDRWVTDLDLDVDEAREFSHPVERVLRRQQLEIERLREQLAKAAPQPGSPADDEKRLYDMWYTFRDFLEGYARQGRPLKVMAEEALQELESGR